VHVLPNKILAATFTGLESPLHADSSALPVLPLPPPSPPPPGELPSAEQPPGLSVQLLPYQRQTLHFMQQQEDLPRGFADHFYIPLTMPCGTQYWYSPVWRHACLEPPATPKGGFLGECFPGGGCVCVCGGGGGRRGGW
jgi:hypothetical protein